jgi:hypothetical protein
VSYTVKDPLGSQDVSAPNGCGYSPTFSVGTQTLTNLVSVTGSTLSWSTNDITLPAGEYTAVIMANFGSSFTISKTLIINLSSCVSENTFPITTPVSYTVKDDQDSQVLAATDSCGYSITYSKGTTWPSWVTLSGSIVSCQTTDLTLTGGDYNVDLVVTFGSPIPTVLTDTLTIVLLPCVE